MKATALPILLLGLASAPAFAQSQMVEVSDDVQIDGFVMTADDLTDLDVYDESGNEIGEVSEVLGSDDQTPMALAVDFSDDETDYGDQDRIVPMGQVTQTQDGLELSSDVDIGSLETYDD